MACIEDYMLFINDKTQALRAMAVRKPTREGNDFKYNLIYIDKSYYQ